MTVKLQRYNLSKSEIESILDLIENFIVEKDVICSEDVFQSDRIVLSLPELMTNIVKVIEHRIVEVE